MQNLQRQIDKLEEMIKDTDDMHLNYSMYEAQSMAAKQMESNAKAIDDEQLETMQDNVKEAQEKLSTVQVRCQYRTSALPTYDCLFHHHFILWLYPSMCYDGVFIARRRH